MSNGDRLAERLDSITPDEVAEFLAKRYHLLTTADGNICTPAAHGVSKYWPFTNSEYHYTPQLGHINNYPWDKLLAMDPKKLIHPNPFELSQLRRRKDGTPCFRIWDSTVAIPACSYRTNRPMDVKDIAPVRRNNTFWLQTILPALQRVGPLGMNGDIVRTSGRYILDFTRMEHKYGWKLMEAAHVLAHLRADDKAEHRKYATVMGRTSGRFMEAVSEITAAMFYDLPMDVTNKMTGTVAEPDTYFLTELKSSSKTRIGAIKLPCLNNEAPRFDRTLSVMLVNILIEPPPLGFITGGMTWQEHDRWTGMPTLAIIAGWEGIDYITHQALGETPGSPIDYVVPCVDLLDPDSYWYYLWLARQAVKPSGEPLFEDPRVAAARPDSRWRYIDEWIESPEYAKLLAQTPPLPCKSCMQINTAAEGAPKRPRGRRPANKDEASKEWLAWFKAEDDIYGIAKNAIESYETLWYGGANAMRTRRARKKAHNAKMDRIYLRAGFNKLQTTLDAKGNLSSAGQARYLQLQEELKTNDGNRAT